MSGYRKYYYWVDAQGLKKVKDFLGKESALMAEEAHLPCRVLRPSKEMGCVLPRAWEGLCKRKTSWYHGSDKAGKILLVSSRTFMIEDLQSPTEIMESDFSPDRLPTVDEIGQLINAKEYQDRKPDEWEKIDSVEKDFSRRWFSRHGGGESFGFERIFLAQCANHANFLHPRFFVILDGAKAPYSIAGSLRTCSSCLEFFDILGSQWPVKYVVPCIGAVQFARLPMDRYFRVGRVRGEKNLKKEKKEER